MRRPAPAGGARTGTAGRRVRRVTGWTGSCSFLMVAVPDALCCAGLAAGRRLGAAVLHQLGRDRRPGLRSSRSALQNYGDVFTELPAVLARDRSTTCIWLAVLFFIATPLGMFFAVLLDREIAGDADLPDGDLPAGRAVPGADRLHLAADLLRGPGPAERRDRQRNVDWYGDPASTSGRCSSPPAGGIPATSCCCTWPG